jgi:hypothetical protein
MQAIDGRFDYSIMEESTLGASRGIEILQGQMAEVAAEVRKLAGIARRWPCARWVQPDAFSCSTISMAASTSVR